MTTGAIAAVQTIATSNVPAPITSPSNGMTLPTTASGRSTKLKPTSMRIAPIRRSTQVMVTFSSSACWNMTAGGTVPAEISSTVVPVRVAKGAKPSPDWAATTLAVCNGTSEKEMRMSPIAGCDGSRPT